MSHSSLSYFKSLSLSVSALVVTALVLPSQVLAAWSAPANLRTFTMLGLPTGNASVAVNASGDGVVVWIDETTSRVMYALQKNGVWTSAKVLYAPSVAKNETTDSAKVTIQPDGTALAVFSSTTPGALQYCVSGTRVVRCYGPSKSFAKVATLSPGALVWSKATLSAQGVAVTDTQIAVDQYGNATASWTYLEKAGAFLELQVASKSPTQSWTAPLNVHQLDNLLAKPNLSIASSGGALLVWQEKRKLATDVSYDIKAVFSDQAISGVWGAAETVANLATPAWTVRSAIDGFGKLAVIWDENYSITWAKRPCQAGCAWVMQSLFTAPVDYSEMASTPDIAANDSGDFLLAWNKVSALGNTVEAHFQQVDGQMLSASWYGDTEPRVSMARDGSIAVVAWVDNGDYSAHSASFTASAGVWTKQPQVRLGSALWGSQIALATADSGRASSVWLSNTAREFVYKYLGSVLR